MTTGNNIGVCSWCLSTNDVNDALRIAREQLGLSIVQIGFFGEAAINAADPEAIRASAQANAIKHSASFVLFDNEDYSSISAVACTGGLVPDGPFGERMALLARMAKITATLGIERVSIHAGTIPRDTNDPLWTKLIERFGAAADLLAEHGLRLLFETGQEPAAVLANMLDALDRPNTAVNFDSGNFVMYGTDDPPAAAALLANRIEHVHLKDAKPGATPGQTWGEEVTLGAGAAGIPDVVATLAEEGYTGPLVIERSRRRSVPEVKASVDYLRQLLASSNGSRSHESQDSHM